MMRQDVKTVSSEDDGRGVPGGVSAGLDGQVVAVDTKGRYAGLVMVAEAHAAELTRAPSFLKSYVMRMICCCRA